MTQATPDNKLTYSINNQLGLIQKLLHKKYNSNFSSLELVDLHTSASTPQATIRSDSLNLEQKIFVENQLLTNISRTKLAVRFKKSEPVASRNSSIITNFTNTQKTKKIPGVKKTLAIYSAKGGVGKSTITTLIAQTLANAQQRTGILDADLYGPSIHSLLGLTGQKPQTKHNKIQPTVSPEKIQCASFGLLTPAQNALQWRGPMISKAITQMCFDVNWDNLDWLVFDFPPGTGDIQQTLFDKIHFDAIIVVTTAQELAMLDTKRTLGLLAHKDLVVTGIVENMAHYTCEHCNKPSSIWKSLNPKSFLRDYGYEILSSVTIDKNIAANSGHLNYNKIPRKIKESLNDLVKKITC